MRTEDRSVGGGGSRAVVRNRQRRDGAAIAGNHSLRPVGAIGCAAATSAGGTCYGHWERSALRRTGVANSGMGRHGDSSAGAGTSQGLRDPVAADRAAQLGEVRFRFFRSLFFPACRLTRTQVLERATELHDRLQALCQARGIRAIETQDHWYGLDPIHIRRRHRRHAWRDICRI